MSSSLPLSFIELPKSGLQHSDDRQPSFVRSDEGQESPALPKSPERAFTSNSFRINTRGEIPESFSPPDSGLQTPVNGTQTPIPLLGRRLSDEIAREALIHALNRQTSEPADETADAVELGSPTHPVSQGIPSELGSFVTEIIFVLVCTTGQLLFSFLLGNVTINQLQLKVALDIGNSQLPWLTGAFMLANGLSVVISGALADLSPPRGLIVGAFLWLTLWNIIGCFSVHPSKSVLFFIVRAAQGLSVGVLVSATISILGRVYKPGIRKNRVFSLMAAGAPLGFWLGAMQGGALAAHLPWIFGSSAILTGLCAVAAYFSIPSLRPASDSHNAVAPSMRNFDYLGAAFCASGCAITLFGLTQGSATNWAPYTYIALTVGLLLLAIFPLIERRASRPLIPNKLWSVPGFSPLMLSYFLGIGSYVGAWQFYAVQFWLRFQHASVLRAALYVTPNAVVGVLATWIISRTMHLFPGHWILTFSMFAYALGPAMFLPQTPNTSYWALSFLATGLASFGPDLSFAAASIFITSSVQRSYQGSAGSLLVTIQNLSAAIMTAVSDSIGVRVDPGPDGEIGLDGIKAIWWFALALPLIASVITAVFVRIPKTAEKEHVS